MSKVKYKKFNNKGPYYEKIHKGRSLVTRLFFHLTPKIQVPNNAKLVSLDVKNLFTSVPLRELRLNSNRLKKFFKNLYRTELFPVHW